MANLGYIQVIRSCTNHCGFCSNPPSGYEVTLDEIIRDIDDLAARGYFGVIFTGGEPTLSPHLIEAIRHAREHTTLHTRIITNGSAAANGEFAASLVDAGLQHVNVSIYSSRPEVEAFLRGVADPHAFSYAAIENFGRHAGRLSIDINMVINRYNADHLDETVREFVRRFPYVGHYVWNNIDPSMGRAADTVCYVHRLRDCEVSLARAMRFLSAAGKTFRVERMPLCYMAEFPHCSTETRKIVKDEERFIYFLDAKGAFHQQGWRHKYDEACGACSLREVCAGLSKLGGGFDPAELSPMFTDPDVVRHNVWATTPAHERRWAVRS